MFQLAQNISEAYDEKMCNGFSTRKNRGSSVIIVSRYRLDDSAIEVRSLAAAKGFFL
jgi:hypothetical protein